MDLRPYLLDLYEPFDPDVARPYDPVDLVRFALTYGPPHWAGLALQWLDQGVPASDLVDDLEALEQQRRYPQSDRHLARRLRKAAQS